MPELGEVLLGREIGIANGRDSHKFVWLACPACGFQRWVADCVTRRKGYTGKCYLCSRRKRRLFPNPILANKMPEIGEIRYGWDIPSKRDKSFLTTRKRYIWQLCPLCNQGFWADLMNAKRPNFTGLCFYCNSSERGKLNNRRGEANACWKGGRIKRGEYIHIKVNPGDFYYPMAGKQGYIAEHRLIMAKYLNRCLLPWEIVHHKNGIANNNRLENLQLLSPSRHIPSTRLANEVKKLKIRVDQLERENRLLKWQIKQLQASEHSREIYIE